LHPTRTQFFNHSGDFTKTEHARTVYTGNYVFTRKGLENFIPFADLKLRMAGPVLGRILKARLKNRFVSANLPLLHRRTISDARMNEFRSGISEDKETIDLSDEFHRQFWGDVMLFSIEKLIGSGYPDSQIELLEISGTVNEILKNIFNLYREQQAKADEKVLKLRQYLSDPGCWWNIRTEMKSAVNNFNLFCSFVENNFGVNSGCLKKLSAQINEGSQIKMIIKAIHSFHEDEYAWNELLKTDMKVTSVHKATQHISG
jgi:hypothetical protein